MTTRAAIVVPCFDEERRLDRARMLAFADEPGIELLFVDDGSRDKTRSVIEDLARGKPDRIGVLALDRNGGKGEAVRRGLLRALEGGAPIVGYVDADLSTPPDEVVRLKSEMDTTAVSVVIASRVQLVGRRIERKNTRHALGRLLVGVGGEPGLPVSEFLEVPLRVWVDAPGSKVDFKGMARSLVDLALIDAELVRLRRARKGGS